MGARRVRRRAALGEPGIGIFGGEIGQRNADAVVIGKRGDADVPRRHERQVRARAGKAAEAEIERRAVNLARQPAEAVAGRRKDAAPVVQGGDRAVRAGDHRGGRRPVFRPRSAASWARRKRPISFALANMPPADCKVSSCLSR